MFRPRFRRRGRNVNSRWCPKCGKRNPITAKFCSVCATKLEIDLVMNDDKAT